MTNDYPSPQAKELYQKAQEAFENDKFEEAINLYTQAIKECDNYASAYFNRALAYAIINKFEEAKADAVKVMKLEPNAADAPFVMGIVEKYAGNYDAAARWLHVSLSKDPNYTQAQTVLNSLPASVTSSSENQTVKAKTASNSSPVSVSSHSIAENYAKELFDTAKKLFDEGNLEQCEFYCSLVLGINIGYADALFLRVKCYLMQGNPQRASYDAIDFLRRNPESAQAYYLLGLIAENQGQYDLAKSNYEKSLEKNPAYNEAADGLARLQKGKTNGAPFAVKPFLKMASNENIGSFVPEMVTNLSFQNVIDLEEVKTAIKTSIIMPLEKPKLAKEYGVEIGGGVLLYGPPGCGKTLIVKAAVGEAKVNLISVKIFDVLNEYVGNTEKGIHNAFVAARQNAPSILFFDEVDAIGTKREASNEPWERKAVNAFLMEMDDLASSGDNVMVIGATNAPWFIDDAIKRSGRLGNFIYVPAPSDEFRAELFRMYLKDKPLDVIDYGKLAKATKFRTAADITHICDMATRNVFSRSFINDHKENISMKDLLDSIAKLPPTLSDWYESVYSNIAGLREDETYAALINAINDYEKSKTLGQETYR